MIIIIILLLLILLMCSLLESSFSSLNIIRIKKMMENKNERAKKVYMLYSNYYSQSSRCATVKETHFQYLSVFFSGSEVSNVHYPHVDC